MKLVTFIKVLNEQNNLKEHVPQFMQGEILSKICQVWKRKCKGGMQCVYVCAQRSWG
jgi:hypothetical protein